VEVEAAVLTQRAARTTALLIVLSGALLSAASPKWAMVKSESLTPVGTLGAGVEYFLDDNISIGVEFKYLFAGEQTLTVGGVGQKINASTPLTSIGVRLYYPELRPAPMADAREPTPTRLYLGLRIGVALPTDTDLTSEIEARPVPVAWGDALAQYFGIGLGLRAVGRHGDLEPRRAFSRTGCRSRRCTG